MTEDFDVDAAAPVAAVPAHEPDSRALRASPHSPTPPPAVPEHGRHNSSQEHGDSAPSVRSAHTIRPISAPSTGAPDEPRSDQDQPAIEQQQDAGHNAERASSGTPSSHARTSSGPADDGPSAPLNGDDLADAAPPTTPTRGAAATASVTPLRSPAALGFRRRSPASLSPVSLPIRSDEPRRPQKLDTVDENAPLPSGRLASPYATPRGSPERGGPYDDSPARASLASVVREYPDPGDIGDGGSDADNELIFDDKDTRLPPVTSPGAHSQYTSPRAEGVAVSELDLPPDDLPPDEFNEMDEGGGPLGEHLFGPMLEPAHVEYSTDHHGPSVFYPAPIPMQLMLPPLLSERSKNKARQRPGLRRPKSAIMLNAIPEPPQWGPSPLEDELRFVSKQQIVGDTASLDSVPVGDLVDDDEEEYANSDRATIMSEDRDDFDDPLDAPFNGPVPGGSPVGKKSKNRRSWLGRTWEVFTGKDGRWKDENGVKHGGAFDEDEDEVLRAQMGAIDDDFAFTRLDPELVQRHAQMFHAGGVHSSTVPSSGKPTSLIEEIEIRKAGKKIQQQLLLREKVESERQRLYEQGRDAGHMHPVDALGTARPTLLHLQQMADADYKQRREWHQRAINKDHIQDHPDETLAQRRARKKAEAQARKAASGATNGPPETLSQRRERLRRARLAAGFAAHGRDAVSINSVPSVRSLSERESADQAPLSPEALNTPEMPTEPLEESPEFDMVNAVATMPSPTSQMFTSPAR